MHLCARAKNMYIYTIIRYNIFHSKDPETQKHEQGPLLWLSPMAAKALHSLDSVTKICPLSPEPRQADEAHMAIAQN